jgi:long-chain acyl-CoA synthetase
MALLFKNCSWWMVTDLAIWSFGYVSVPPYPTLAADTVCQILADSDAKVCFIGKLDSWETMEPGVPADMRCSTTPCRHPTRWPPTWSGLPSAPCTEPMPADPLRGEDEFPTLVYTLGTIGMPNGVMQSFGSFAWVLGKGIKRIPVSGEDRLLSQLPLAHTVGRMLVKHSRLRTRMHVFFAEWLDLFAANSQRSRPTVFSTYRACGSVLAGRLPQAATSPAQPHAGAPILGGIVRTRRSRRWAWTSANTPPAAPRPCHRRCCSGAANFACISTRAAARPRT